MMGAKRQGISVRPDLGEDLVDSFACGIFHGALESEGGRQGFSKA
jgi:hypothetical protein